MDRSGFWFTIGVRPSCSLGCSLRYAPLGVVRGFASASGGVPLWDAPLSLRSSGGSRRCARRLGFAYGYQEHRYFVGVGTVGQVVFTLEVVGFTGAIPETMRRLSVGGRCFGITIAVSGGDNVRYAVDGELVVYEEPWGPVYPLRAADPRWDPNWCKGLIGIDDPDDIWGLGKLVLAERVMQTRVEEDWIRRPLRTVELPDLTGDPQFEQLWHME